jgi:hypothetical protein
METLPSLSKAQKTFLKSIRMYKREQIVDQKFLLSYIGNVRYAKSDRSRILLRLTDKDLLGLSKMGYLIRYADPPAIVFTSKIFEGQKVIQDPTAPSAQIFRANLIQVYVWLGASLLAAAFALFLLWLTFQYVVGKNLSTSVASALLTMISSLLTGVFFKNYDKANDRLKATRVKPLKSQSKKNDMDKSNKGVTHGKS